MLVAMTRSTILRLVLLLAFCAVGVLAIQEFAASEPPTPSVSGADPSSRGTPIGARTQNGSRTLRGPSEMATALPQSPSDARSEVPSGPVRGLRKAFVRGRVVGPDLPPAPVAGATVGFRTAPAGSLRFVVRSDAEGRFEARIPVGWRVEPVVRADGFCTTPLGRYRRIEDGGVDLGDLGLVRGQVCTGRVLDARTGSEVANARVGVAGLGEDQFVVTGADGRFRFDALAPGEHRLDVSAVGYRSQPLEIELGEDGQTGVEPVVELWPTAVLVVRVVEAETGVPLTGADVSVFPRGQQDPVESFGASTSTAPGSMRMFGAQRATAVGEGRFEIEGLDTGRYRMMTRAPNRVTMQTDIDLSPSDAWPEVRVACPTGRSLEVRVFDPDSMPLPGAWVSLYAEGVEGRTFLARRRAEDGASLRFSGLPSGSYRAVAQPPTGRSDLAANSSETVAVPGRSEVSVSLLRPGRLEGTVTGVADGPVFVVCTDGRSVYSLERRGPGPFVIEGIGAGEYWLRALLTGTGEAGRRRALRRVRRDLQLVSPKPPFDTRIDAGGTTRASVVIDPSEAVDLIVEVTRGGRSLGPGQATLTDQSGRVVKGVLDTMGMLRVLDVPPGRHVLELRSLDGRELWLTRGVELPFAQRLIEVP